MTTRPDGSPERGPLLSHPTIKRTRDGTNLLRAPTFWTRFNVRVALAPPLTTRYSGAASVNPIKQAHTALGLLAHSYPASRSRRPAQLSQFRERYAVRRSTSKRSSARPRQRSGSESAGVFGAVFEAARDRAGAQVGELVEQVKHEGEQFLSERKSLVAGQFTNISGAIRRAADKLHDSDSKFIANYIDRAADTVDDVGQYIADHALREVVEDVGVIARRQPLLFAGGMFLAGLAAARFLKAATAERNGRSRRR